MEKVRKWCGFFNGIDVSTDGSIGELCLTWKGDTTIKLRTFSSNHVAVKVMDNDMGTQWRFRGFYGNPYVRNRDAS